MQSIIDKAWENRDSIVPTTQGELHDAVEHVLTMLDKGELRVAEKKNGEWSVNPWIKKAVLLSFRLRGNSQTDGGWDKIPLKCTHWDSNHFTRAGFRMVPGAVARRGAFIAKDVVLMPSFINVGAYVDEGTMIDTWSTVGSCAQIGKHCHISGGVGIGGVLEPLQANPVIIEDNCFIGARSEVAEGVIVEEGSVISMGVFLGASTKIVDRESGEVMYGRVPAYSVVVPGTFSSPIRGGAGRGASGYDDVTQSPNPNSLANREGISLACAVIVKRVDEKTRSKTGINELLRS